MQEDFAKFLDEPMDEVAREAIAQCPGPIMKEFRLKSGELLGARTLQCAVKGGNVESMDQLLPDFPHNARILTQEELSEEAANRQKAPDNVIMFSRKPEERD